jgi:hypothetical protein
MKGVVRLFSSGNDSTDVRVEVFREGDNGAVGEAVGKGVVTRADDATTVREDILSRCPDGGCWFRGYSLPNVPTETRLIVRTSSGVDTDPGRWGTVYEYSVYIPNTSVSSDGFANFDPTAIAPNDLGTVAAAAGTIARRQERGMLIAEVLDCAGVRLANVTADIDAAHDGNILYFDDEKNPLPDRTRDSFGTTKLGTFGALNVGPIVPTRVSAIADDGGRMVLVGTDVVQTFQNALTIVKLRGRRPWQR